MPSRFRIIRAGRQKTQQGYRQGNLARSSPACFHSDSLDLLCSKRSLAHQRKLIPVRIPKLSQPKLDLCRSMYHVRARPKLNATRRERLENRLDVRHLKIYSSPSLRRLICGQNPDQQPYPADLEKRHLRRSSEQKRKPSVSR